MSFNPFKKLARGLSRTRRGIASALRTAVAGQPVDEQALEDLETGLLAADLGPALAIRASHLSPT